MIEARRAADEHAVRADQSCVSPSQPVRSLPLTSGVNPAVSTTGGQP